MAGEWITRITDAARKAGMLGAAGLSPAVRRPVAEGAEVEAALLKLKAVTRPDDWDGVVDECLRRAARAWVLDAIESVYRDVAMGWRPGLSEAELVAYRHGDLPPALWHRGGPVSEPTEHPDPDLDDLSDDELHEVDPQAAAVAGVLDRWYDERCCCRHHMVGTFLDLLAAEGYRVEPIVVPSFESLLPPAVD